jgi:hypothetical protein
MEIAGKLWIDWDRNGVFTDESAYLVRASGRMRIASPEDSITSPRGIISIMSIELENGSHRFSTINTGGALYANIGNGGYYQVPVYFEASDDGGSNFYRLFTGVIKGPVQDGVGFNNPGVVRFDCRGREDLILQKRISTTQATFKTIYDQGWTESEIIAQWLTDAGLSSSDYTLDPGLFVIPWAWLDDESVIEDVWALAASCGGYFYCDPDGEFRYENMQHWLKAPHLTSQETLTPGDFQSVSIEYDDTELYQFVVLEVSPRMVEGEGVVWEAQEVIEVAPDSTKLVVAHLQQPAYEYTGITYTAVTAGGNNMAGNFVNQPVASYYAQRVGMSFTNTNTVHRGYIQNLQILGKSVHGGPTVEIGKASSDSFWTGRQGRTRSIRSNAYIQTTAQGEALANFLRDRHQKPRLTFNVAGALGNPQRRLGDRITIDDKTTLSDSTQQVIIIGIDWQYGSGGFKQNLECISATELYPYILASPDYFVLDTDTLNPGTASPGRVFY